jgi:hypothetical protein
MNETIPITSRLVLAEAIDKKASFKGTVSGVTTLPTGASKLDIDIGNDTIPVVVSGHQSADLIHEQVAGIGMWCALTNQGTSPWSQATGR